MKKLLVLGTALVALNALASEVQVKSGYDFNRKYKGSTSDVELSFEKGPVAGLEYIFDNQGEFEWGIGAEYKLSTNSGSTILEKRGLPAGVRKVRFLRNAPVYALGKFNVATSKAGNDTLYVLGRAGYGFVANGKDLDVVGGVKYSGGLYVAGGIGTEHGPFSLEALYENQSVKLKNHSQKNSTKNNLETFGVRLGYRFGRLVNDRAPKIVEKVVTRTVEVPVPVVTPAPVAKPVPAKNITTNNVVLPFSCEVDKKVCVIRGFKVDGREPNQQEAADLRSIANVINQFAEGGTIDFVGHTDSTGSDMYNKKLSVVRAQNVARLLKEYGLKNTVSYGKIIGKGEMNPSDTNGTVQGRYNNRRVELYFNNVDFTNVNFVK